MNAGDANIDQLENQFRRANETLEDLKQERDQLENKLAVAERNKKVIVQKLQDTEGQLEKFENSRNRLEKQRRDREELAEAQFNTRDKDLLDELESNIRGVQGELDDARKVLDKEVDSRNKLKERT